MKFYEFNDFVYYALIYAENEQKAIKYYKEVVSDIEEDGKPDEVTKDYAYKKLKECDNPNYTEEQKSSWLEGLDNAIERKESYIVLMDEV